MIILKTYKISIVFTLLMLAAGLSFLFICILALIDEFFFLGILILIIPGIFIYYSFYLLKKRRENTGFYWDDEGIIIDLDGNKVYWYEIEDIVYSGFPDTKATVISTHYTHHENIRIRHKKWQPTIAHIIYWYLMAQPKDYHKNLILTWEEKKKKPI
ncbi:hypothetical protein ACTFOB_00160 [Bacillus cereus group sp. MYBK79-1]|uniref:hypothetical protein n=1 Tax=unclassified Bacillus cereus group TaxID=2750818 RepID=UPI003F79BB9B